MAPSTPQPDTDKDGRTYLQVLDFVLQFTIEVMSSASKIEYASLAKYRVDMSEPT